MNRRSRAPGYAGAFFLLGTLIVLLVLPAGAGLGGEGDALLKPDLRTRKPNVLAIDKSSVPGTTLLRFSNLIVNKGAGPIELRPQEENCRSDGDMSDERVAYQRIYPDSNGDGFFDRSLDNAAPIEAKAGCSEFHPEHNHWHFENFARYELLSFESDGDVGALVSDTTISDKVSFCLVDTQRVAPRTPGSPEQQYYKGNSEFVGCAADDTMGISIGWADLYSTWTPGQHVDITEVPNGTYCLRSTVDPTDLLDETREKNNKRAIRVTLKKNASVVDYLPLQSC
ncbi:MAG: lysyl oxidase family protein [Actinomycetota bacterium]|nr:lysyl oxidase family protein [Actinomycetota bacterium]